MSEEVKPSSARAKVAGRILVIDDMPFCRELVSEAMRSHGFATVTAANGAEGIAAMAREAIDLAICDVEMPVMNGFEFMRTLRAREEWRNVPVILLTSGMQRERIVEAGRLKAAEYLLKGNFSVEMLLSRVNRWLEQRYGPTPATGTAEADRSADQAAAVDRSTGEPQTSSAPGPARDSSSSSSGPILPKLLEGDQMLAVVASSPTRLKTLPGLQEELKTLLSAPHPSTSELVDLIRQDPVASVRLIQSANDARLATKARRIVSIEEAVRALGPVAVGDLIMRATPIERFDRAGVNGLALLRQYQHSLLVGKILSQIMPRNPDMTPGAAYLTGMCHDLVQIILRQLLPNEFSAACDYATQAKTPVCRLLPSVFGTKYFELARQAVGALKLPPQWGEPICECADFEAGGRPPQSHMGFALRAANELANALQLVPSPDEAFLGPLSQAQCQTACVMTTQLNAAELRSEAIMSMRMLSRADSLESDLEGPMAPGFKPRVWYVRHPSFSALDPLGVALGLLCKMDAGPTLPGRDDSVGVQGVVVATPSLEHGGTPFGAVERWQQMMQPKPAKVLFAVDDPVAPERSSAHVRTVRLPISLSELAGCVAWLSS